MSLDIKLSLNDDVVVTVNDEDYVARDDLVEQLEDLQQDYDDLALELDSVRRQRTEEFERALPHVRHERDDLRQVQDGQARTIGEQQKTIGGLERNLRLEKARLTAQSVLLEARDARIQELEAAADRAAEEIRTWGLVAAQRDREIATLKAQVDELEAVTNLYKEQIEDLEGDRDALMERLRVYRPGPNVEFILDNPHKNEESHPLRLWEVQADLVITATDLDVMADVLTVHVTPRPWL